MDFYMVSVTARTNDIHMVTGVIALLTSTWSPVLLQTMDINMALCYSIGHGPDHSPLR